MLSPLASFLPPGLMPLGRQLFSFGMEPSSFVFFRRWSGGGPVVPSSFVPGDGRTGSVLELIFGVDCNLDSLDRLLLVMSYFTVNSPVAFRLSISTKMNIALEMIDELVVEINNFHFLQHIDTPSTDHLQTHSHVDESEIVGRKEEKEQVVKILLDRSHNNNSNIVVLPIVGMGGIGKTTLAQFVHNDQRVVHHFELVLWVCVSHKFVVEEIIRSIVEVATMKKCDLTQMEALQKQLGQVLGKKRYLIVLDDVWNEDSKKWDDMRSLLCTNAGPGSALIVTSRSDRVASIMGTLPTHQISLLNEDQSWELFQRNAYGREVEKQEDSISVAKNIVYKCKGLPLAIKAMAALLRLKHCSQWFSVLDSDVWKNDILAIGIVPALQLSYDHLPSEAKICFSFCAIFPKDRLLDKDMLIQLWMANDFITSETRGQQIFDVLVWRCFLQDVEVQKNFLNRFDYEEKDEYIDNDEFLHRPTTCKMHDLMHDLAEIVSGNDCYFLQDSSSHQEILQGSTDASSLQHEVRHLSLDYVGNHTYAAMKKILTPEARTILVHPELKRVDTIRVNQSRFVSLRALKAFPMAKHMTDFKHLRYLDCSCLAISALPESTAMLYILQTLKLMGCRCLKKLPEGMRYMSSLRHIYLIGCHYLEHMPQGIGRLNSLVTLTNYVFASDPGCGIDQLKDLNLEGSLTLTELRKVHSAENAKQGNMSAKHKLKRLSLDWENGTHSTHVGPEVDTNAEAILESLCPHKWLEILVLSNYSDAKLLSWMHNSTLLEHLSELRLSRCKNCKELPPLWQLPSLKYLGLDSMDSLDSLTSICVGNDDTYNMESCISPPPFFAKLETMIVSRMPKLERWHQEVVGQVANVSFPHLKRLDIYFCPMLASMPKILPLLEDLRAVITRDTLFYHLMNLSAQYNLECKGIIRFSRLGWQPLQLRFSRLGDSAVELILSGWTEIVETFADELNRIPCRFIKHLHMYNCDDLFSSEPSQIQRNIWNHFRFVEDLEISGNNKIVQWPAVECRNLNRLQGLHLACCSNLSGSLPSTISDDENVLHPRLQNLNIEQCENLMEVPKLPASLEKLYIASCPKLMSMPTILGNIKNLRELSLTGCDALATFPDGMYGVIALKKLIMKRCPRVETLPEGLLQQLPALEILYIRDCPNLEGAFSRGGVYWNLVEAIPKKSVGAQVQLAGPCAKFFACL